MSIPAMYIVGLAFNVVFLALCLFGYFFLNKKTSQKWNFIAIFACAWLVSALSYALLILGMHPDETYITFIRLVSYVLFLATIVSLIIELVKIKAS
jgi:hypothetical protein